MISAGEGEPVKPFHGELGAEVTGGGRPGDALTGKHVFLVMDSAAGFRRALPARRQRGDLGSCSRIFQNMS